MNVQQKGVQMGFIRKLAVRGYSKELKQMIDNLSKLSTEQITNILMERLQAKGAACILTAQHFCMTARGVEKQKSKMITSSLKGSFLQEAKARQELIELIK